MAHLSKDTEEAGILKSGGEDRKGKRTPETVFHPDITEEERGRNAPSEEEIRQRAFEIYIERSGIRGCDLDDWLRAEYELQEKYKRIERGVKE